VFETVTGPVNAGSLAIPNAKYTIDLFFWIGFNLLRAQYCCRSEFLIDSR